MVGEEIDLAVTLWHVDRVQEQIRRAGRWYPPMMAGFGLGTIALVACLPAVRSTEAGIAFTLVAVASAAVLVWWKSRQDVRPASRAHRWRWSAAWAVLYAAGTCWFGPAYLGDHVGWWALMGFAVAAPAFAEAGRVWERGRR